LNELPEIFQK